MSDNLVFFQTGKHPCSYLPDTEAQTVFLDPEIIMGVELLELLHLNGFRRSGDHLYRPKCPTCSACKSSRVVVDDFKFSRRFKRILKKNSDLNIELVDAEFFEEHYQLYDRYISTRHADGDMYPPTPDHYRDFLVSDLECSKLMEIRDPDGKLVGASAIDLLLTGPSAIYTYFDPDLSDRSIGAFAILKLIELSSNNNLPFVYLGYWIENCSKMSYKSEYQPLEIFTENQWQKFQD